MNTAQAQTTIAQLGGPRFNMMTGANSYIRDEQKNTLRFKIGRNSKGVNLVTVTLNPSDTYTMEFASYRALTVKVKATVSGIYGDQLQSIFTQHTGMYTSLGTMGR